MINNTEYGDTYTSRTQNKPNTVLYPKYDYCYKNHKGIKKNGPRVKICWNDIAALVSVTEEESVS